LSLSSQKYGFGIQDPENLYWIPDTNPDPDPDTDPNPQPCRGQKRTGSRIRIIDTRKIFSFCLPVQ